MTALYDEDMRSEHDEDESFERELFARRAHAMDLPALSADDAILRGQALREKTRRTRAVRWLGESARSVNGVVASLTVAAAALFFVVGGMQTRAMRVLAEPTITPEAPATVDAEGANMTSASLVCSTPSMSTLFSSVCEAPSTGALASVPASHVQDLADAPECAVSRDDLACESSPCDRDVTCSRKMP